MKRIHPAHLRRAAALLRFIDEEKGGAEVVVRGRSLGAWKCLKPLVHADAGGIRMVLRTPTGNRSFKVSGVRMTTSGAELLLVRRGRHSERSLDILWREEQGGDRGRESTETALCSIVSWMRSEYAGCRILSFSRTTDRTDSLSGAFHRIRAGDAHGDHLILAAGQDSSAAIPFVSALTQALLWITHLRKKGGLSQTPRAHIVVPPEYAGVMQHRAALLDRAAIETAVWQYEDLPGETLAVRKAPLPAPPQENREFRWPVLGPFRWTSRLAQIIDLAPAQIKRYPRFQEYDSLRLCGLEFATARGDARDVISFGVGDERLDLDDDNFDQLRKLVEAILYFRRADCPDPHHPYYRLQAERWLEALILENVPDIFPELMPESVYSQIPVYLGKDPGRVDILGADKRGTLVVLELKVSPDPDLPLQALDYWGRVVRHSEEGDFLRRGYFSGIRLSGEPPKIYLVSPIFSAHDSIERIVRFFMPRLEIWKVLINEDWRCGVKVLRRTRLRCGDEASGAG